MILQIRPGGNFVDAFLSGLRGGTGAVNSFLAQQRQREALAMQREARAENEAQQRAERITATQAFEQLRNLSDRFREMQVEPPTVITQALNLSRQFVSDAGAPADLGTLAEPLQAALQAGEQFLSGVEQVRPQMQQAIKRFGSDPSLLQRSPSLQQAIAIAQAQGGLSPLQSPEVLALAPFEIRKSDPRITDEFADYAIAALQALKPATRVPEAVETAKED